MVFLMVLWLILFFFSFGIAGLIFISMRKAASRPWRIKIDESFKPKVSILVPTYNESNVIRFKLENLKRLVYPKDLTQIIIVDSNSEDHTIDIANDFIMQHPELNIQVVTEREKRGKSSALNAALKSCEGDMIIVSDADCFWPSDILNKALPFLADPEVGAISGPKILLNSEQSWVTKTEDAYLKSINVMKLGESKLSSTLLFEGGFSAYKREVLESFDPYNTGSDDCGTIIGITEKGSKALFIPEAAFFTIFPTTWKGKMGIKVRRASQLVQVFTIYLSLLIRRRVKSAKRIMIQGAFIYLVSPIIFILLLATTIALLLNFPYFIVFCLALLVPKVRFHLLEFTQSCLLLLVGVGFLTLKKRFTFWGKPEDRTLLMESVLRKYMLI